MKWDRQSSRGSAWVELLLAMSVMSILAVTGMRAITGLIRQMEMRVIQQSETAEIAGLQAHLRRAWHARRAHVFREEGTWLRIHSIQSVDGAQLESLSLNCYDTEGREAIWRLERREAGWLVEQLGAADSVSSIRLDYNGRIRIRPEAGEWIPGTRPEGIYLQFPDARHATDQHGFAIHANW